MVGNYGAGLKPGFKAHRKFQKKRLMGSFEQRIGYLFFGFEAPLSMAKMISQREESKYQVETALETWNSFT